MSGKNEQKMQFGAEVGKVLHLMIHSLYANKDIFLRELISNASDACDRLRYEALTTPALLKDGAELGVRLAVDEKARTLTVGDNGIGMSREELAQNLGTIARSGTQEFLARVTGGGKGDCSLIGQFGVGFYSAFMVAERVRVVTRKAGEEAGHAWESDGGGEFTIAEAEGPVPRGTSITLHLREGEEAYLDKFRLRHIVQTYSDHIGFPIHFIDGEGKQEQIGSGAALWTRPKAEITPEQYNEFYRHVAHAPDQPWLTLHYKGEGKVEYTALLFVPSLRPFDLFHPDRRGRVKLYVRRVFITEQSVELLPAWLRFLRGVIDSEDLPLNISRETLQHNPVLERVREAVVKKLLAELKKKAESDAEGYGAFWTQFGAVLKEGLCEAASPKEQIFETCLFAGTAGPSPARLEDYLARMKPGQEHIYYLTGAEVESLRRSPQIEGFVRRGVEVLLLADHVDDFWTSLMPEYKGKRFKSVTRADIDLSGFEEQPQERSQSTEESVGEAEMKTLLDRLKRIYGDQVKDVRASSKLNESPVCLAVEEGAMDIRLERFLVEQKQLPGAAAKILEINPRHALIRALAASRDGDIESAAWLLLDQARIVEGEQVHDPAAFARRLSECLQRGLAA